MDVNEFRHELINEAKLRATDGYDATAFVEVVMEKLIDADIVDDYVPTYCSIENNRGNREYIFGYSFEDSQYGCILNIVVCKYVGKTEPEQLIRTELEKIANQARTVYKAAKNGSLRKTLYECDPAISFVDIVNNKKKPIKDVKILLITDGVHKDSAKELKIDPLDGIEFDIKLWDVVNLYKEAIVQKGTNPIHLDFSPGLNCFRAEIEGEEFESYMCAIPGKVLADVFNEYHERVLESNVRSFQSRSKKNLEMKKTIGSQPGRFFAYNNGITATVSSLQVADGKIVSVDSLQIVNGGQTTVTVFNAQYKDGIDTSKILIPMKISIIPSETKDADEIIMNIARYANTQNKIDSSDFASTNPYHKKMEFYSRNLSPPASAGLTYSAKYFYVRAKGQYEQKRLSLDKKALKSFDLEFPKDKVIKKTELAQIRSAFLMMPHDSSKPGEKMFVGYNKSISDEFAKNPDKYNEMHFKECASMVLIFRTLLKRVKKEEWYKGGYPNATCYYAISKTLDMMENHPKKYKIDYLSIWNKQSVPEELIKQLLSNASEVYYILTNDPNHTNVSEYAKTPGCWEKIRSESMNFIPGVFQYLISDKEYQEEIEKALEEERIKAEKNAQDELIKLGQRYWTIAWDFINANESAPTDADLSDDELALIKRAADFSEFQDLKGSECRKLLEIKDKISGLDKSLF